LFRPVTSRVFVPTLAIFAAWIASGCAAAFGPGYAIEKQRVEVSYSQQTPDRVSVRAWYRLKNIGTKPLNVLDIQPPDSEIIQPREIRVEWRGKSLEIPAPKPGDSENELRVPLAGSWNAGESGEFLVSYDVKISPAQSAVGTNHEAAFFLPSSGWLPILLPPHAAFAMGGALPPKWDLSVSVPEGYRVRASGENRGQDKHGTRGAVRFEQRPGANYDAYVAAGPYFEQQVHSSTRTVIFWTANPLTSKRAADLGKLVASDADFFTAEFGTAEKSKSPIWLIECPQGATASPERPWISQTGCLTQPHSVVVSADYLAAATPGEYTKSVDLQLAATWLYFSARPARYSALFPMAAIPDYAGVALAISRNPESRNAIVRDLLRRVDATPDGGKPLVRVDANDSPQLQDRARAESVLFLLALEDRCGAANVRKGIAHASRVLRGKTWAGSDLRSAVEAECGGPVLESFFREWMHGSGIPAEFRARYSAAE
jgi:hypothetical protein